jgi:hypothetical protein
MREDGAACVSHLCWNTPMPSTTVSGGQIPNSTEARRQQNADPIRFAAFITS